MKRLIELFFKRAEWLGDHLRHIRHNTLNADIAAILILGGLIALTGVGLVVLAYYVIRGFI